MYSKNEISLQNYVTQVCKQVLLGVAAAQNDKDVGKFIGRSPVSEKLQDEEKNMITLISFDVRAEVSSSVDGEGNISVPAIASVEGKMSKARSDANRVSFEIPVAIPAPTDQLEVRGRLEQEEKDRQAQQSAIIRSAQSNPRGGY